MPDPQVKVVFCPHDDFKGEPPLPTWPGAEAMALRLKAKAGRAAPIDLDPTDDEGRTSIASVPAGARRIEIPGGLPAGWTLATDELDISATGDPKHIVLVPPADSQHVPLQLAYHDPQTGSGVVPDATVEVLADDGSVLGSFISDWKGHVDAVAPLGRRTFRFGRGTISGTGTSVVPAKGSLTTWVRKAKDPQPVEIGYAPEILLSVKPVVTQPSGLAPLEGATVTLELNGRPVATKELEKGDTEVTFPALAQGTYGISVLPPAGPASRDLTLASAPPDIYLSHGVHAEIPVAFLLAQATIRGRVETEDGKQVTQDVTLLISGDGAPFDITAHNGEFDQNVRAGVSLTISVPDQGLALGVIPLEPPAEDQPARLAPKENVVKLLYKNAIFGRALNEQGSPVPGAMIVIYDSGQTQFGTAIADDQGQFVFGLENSGEYFLSQFPEGGNVAIRERVEVHSRTHKDVQVQTDLAGEGEAFTDLAAYPVLTEEISTIGPPAPAPGGGGRGTGDYGQVVGQVVRDVLGWRPGADVSGFQAALTGAFKLREVEGHTEWTWQQRGYAVQADMGALTGAQASIYARAKSALDQILPLLAGLTPLNPALFPPQDLEAIRTVITTELQELVSELALQGGPRIQRVDQLFELLTGERTGSRNLNPDVVQGNLGTLRERFGLTVDEIDTVDEERIVTNFRIVLEQVLSLQASWSTDRGLLAPLDPRASFGTVLIWLSRSLEAVCESVADLNFALDSVFVDAAQRQVIELKFPGEETLLLSDLLDWVDRASRDEGPRIIQDAGKDGVFAFAPVLRRLRDLIRETRRAARHGGGLPQGMRTPRVDRALQVLVDQLNEATDLASSVRRDAPPVIEAALVFEAGLARSASRSGQPLPTLENLPGRPAAIQVDILGANFRAGASAVLIAQDREDLPEIHTRGIRVSPPNVILATFRNPRTVPGSGGVTWSVAVTNEDGSHSNLFQI